MKLSKANLASIPESEFLKKFSYDLDNVTVSIVHFGPSNFARAHLAVYCDDLISQGHTDCGIIAVSPKIQSGTIERRDTLKEQDFLYTVVERGKNNSHARIIGSMKDLMVGPENPKAVIDLMASPEIKLVSMTITQNGYYYSPGKGFDLDHPDIRESLENSDQPRATVAYIVKALEQRRNAGLPPFAVMSCDNIQHNSDNLKNTVLAYAGTISNDLKHWIADNTVFYNTMVDRIVPQLDPQNIAEVSNQYGIEDNWPLFTEHFKQLVIETKHGPDGLPPFDKAGAQFVENVAPYDEAKIRLLNGLHMALGVVGRLTGETYADQALQRDDLRDFAKGYLAEARETLAPLDGFDYEEYAEKLFERVENPYMKDELQRLARNGTEKKDSRFLSSLIDAYNNDTDRAHMVTALAAWVKYVGLSNPDPKIAEDGPNGFCISDPRAYETGVADIARNLNGDIRSIFAIRGIFRGLENNPSFVKELSEAWSDLGGLGARRDPGPSQSGPNIN